MMSDTIHNAAANLSSLQNGSDIRGIALDLNKKEPVNFTGEQAKLIARGFATWLRKKNRKEGSDNYRRQRLQTFRSGTRPGSV
jgi:hypothetical protein